MKKRKSSKKNFFFKQIFSKKKQTSISEASRKPSLRSGAQTYLFSAHSEWTIGSTIASTLFTLKQSKSSRKESIEYRLSRILKKIRKIGVEEPWIFYQMTNLSKFIYILSNDKRFKRSRKTYFLRSYGINSLD